MPDTATKPHVHKWRSKMHMDGCHFYQWVYDCACGASASSSTERDPIFDPYSLIWMDPEGGEPCERCEQIRNGSEISHSVKVIAKDGTVEKDETTYRKQGDVPEEADDAA